LPKIENMLFLGFLLVVIATFVLYLRSEKTTHLLYSWEVKGKYSRAYLGYTASSLFVLSAVVFYFQVGLFGGFCYGIISFFLAASLILLIRPLLTAERSKVHARK
jgi:hypothetical protein